MTLPMMNHKREVATQGAFGLGLVLGLTLCALPSRNPKINADLTLANLSALKASSLDTESKQEGKYATNGKDPKRIKAVLKSRAASGCKCKQESGAEFCFKCKMKALIQNHCVKNIG